jgi:hypothetical protein
MCIRNGSAHFSRLRAVAERPGDVHNMPVDRRGAQRANDHGGGEA